MTFTKFHFPQFVGLLGIIVFCISCNKNNDEFDRNVILSVKNEEASIRIPSAMFLTNDKGEILSCASEAQLREDLDF